MGKLILHNLRKSKGQFISFGIVMLITAIILSTALVLVFQTGKAYDTLFNNLNTADLSLTVPSEYPSDDLVTDLTQIQGITEINSHEALFATAALQDFQDSEFIMNTFFYPLNEIRDLTQYEIIEENVQNNAMGAYIPLYLSELGGFQISDTIKYIIDQQEYSFVVTGILNEMQYGNYGTDFIGIYLTDEAYSSLKVKDGFIPVTDYLIRIDDSTDLLEVKNSINQLLKNKDIISISLLDRETTKDNRTMVSTTIVLFLIVFAIIVLLISIFLARFKIKNTIDEEINEMGVLKGIGYTSNMVRMSQIFPYIISSLIGLLLGVALSYLIIPVLANVLAVQSGFSYVPTFDFLASIITIILILVAILFFTILASSKIKKLEPINAIRGIDPIKKPRKNHYPLDSSKGSIGLNLIMKQASESLGRNILLFIVTFILMMLLTFSAILFYNVNIRPYNFLTTLSEELPDIRIQSDSEHIDELKDILESQNIKAVNYGLTTTEYTDGTISTIVSEDYDLLENNIAYKGHSPKESNEIAIGNAFEDDYEIGDTFILKKYGKEFPFKITGFIQSVNNNGTIVQITDSGYSNISDSPLNTLNLYVGDDADVDSIFSQLESSYDDYIISITNASKETKSMQVIYSSLITIVTIVLFIITILIVLLILYVILHSMITNLRTDFGIYKAMGFTSNQLIAQTVGSISPIILISALYSAILGLLYLPLMFNGIFSVIGVMKNNFEIPISILLGIAIILTIINILIGILLSLPIKKITAYSLIKE